MVGYGRHRLNLVTDVLLEAAPRRRALLLSVHAVSGLSSLTSSRIPQRTGLPRGGLSGLEDGGQHDHCPLRQGIPSMRINAVEPGYTATDLNSRRGTQTVEEGAEIIVRTAQVARTVPRGSFAVSGQLPW